MNIDSKRLVTHTGTYLKEKKKTNHLLTKYGLSPSQSPKDSLTLDNLVM